MQKISRRDWSLRGCVKWRRQGRNEKRPRLWWGHEVFCNLKTHVVIYSRMEWMQPSADRHLEKPLQSELASVYFLRKRPVLNPFVVFTVKLHHRYLAVRNKGENVEKLKILKEVILMSFLIWLVSDKFQFHVLLCSYVMLLYTLLLVFVTPDNGEGEHHLACD